MKLLNFAKTYFLFGTFLIILLFSSGCVSVDNNEVSEERLYSIFKDPPLNTVLSYDGGGMETALRWMNYKENLML